MQSFVEEVLVGEGPEVAHIDFVIGSKNRPVKTAFMNYLAMPRQGLTHLLAVFELNMAPNRSI